MLGIAILFWILFFKNEARADQPILDLQVLKNRTFITVAGATIFSFFGQIITPYTVLMAFVGVSMESSLRSVFCIGAIAMLLSFLLISTVPEIPLDAAPRDEKSL